MLNTLIYHGIQYKPGPHRLVKNGRTPKMDNFKILLRKNSDNSTRNFQREDYEMANSPNAINSFMDNMLGSGLEKFFNKVDRFVDYFNGWE